MPAEQAVFPHASLSATGRSERVAVRADELALLQFVQDKCSRAATCKIADCADLLMPRQMIPMHDGRGKCLAAVGTWQAVL